MSQTNVVFTPLRIALIITIIGVNLLAVASFFLTGQPWSEALGIFAVVFIMLFVFVILLEVVWLHHRAKNLADQSNLSQYKLAKWIYLTLFVFGFVISYVVLLM